MKCSAVLLLIYAFCVFGNQEVSGENPPSPIVVHNVENGVDRYVKLDGNLTLFKARHILNMSSTDYFYEYRSGDNAEGHLGNLVPIPDGVELYKTVEDITLKNKISIWCLTCDNVLDNFELENGSEESKINSTTPNSTPGGEFWKQLTTNGSQREDYLAMKNDSEPSATDSVHGIKQFPPPSIPPSSNFTNSTPQVSHQNGVHNNSFDSGDIFKYLKGLKVDSRGELFSTNYTVADLKGHPIINNIDKADFKSTTMFNLRKYKMKFSITDNSLRYDHILKYRAVRPDRNGGQHKAPKSWPHKSHNVTRYTVEKQEIKMAEDDLMINNEFYYDIQNALLPGRLELQNALKLLEVLQKYGWFVPLHFTTGGCFYDIHNTEVRDSEQAETGSTTQRNGSPPMATRGNNNAIRIDALNRQLLNPDEWKIVEYKRLLPTLMLLYRYNNWTLSQSLKLLSEFRVQLQPREEHVNIRKYTMALQQILY